MAFEKIKDFFGYVKDNYRSARDNAQMKYFGLRDATSSIAKTLEETLNYTDRTVDKIYFESNGIRGIFDDIEIGAKNICSKFKDLSDNIDTIEDILTSKNSYDSYSNKDSYANSNKNTYAEANKDSYANKNYRTNTYTTTCNNSTARNNSSSTNDAYAPSDVNAKTSSRRPSRFKSAVTATAAGFGTIKGVYDALRTNSYANSKDNKCDKDINYSNEKLSELITIKNKYFWKNTSQLQDIVEKELGIKDNIASLLKDTMHLKATDKRYSSLPQIHYDSRIASEDMKNELYNSYINSDKTLKQISEDFEKKYGMSISVSTLSRNARKHLKSKGYDCKNRKEARKIKR